MIIGFLIWSFCAVIFLGIGISYRNSQNAAGFFTFTKPPDVTDIRKYNRAVSALWLISAALLEAAGIPFLFLKQNSPFFVLVVLFVFLLVIGMMVAFFKIESKYKK